MRTASKKQHTSTKTTTITILSLLFLVFPSQTSPQNCRRFCGEIPLRYPFGSGSGCGDPRFQNYLTCNDNKTLTFNTRRASYPITSIDYSNQLLYISDPCMSTCSSAVHRRGGGGGISLDWDAPFSFNDNTVFLLLECSVEDSPIYSDPKAPLCDDRQGLSVCTYLYSCPAIGRVSTCCVYAPVGLGPAFDVDLEKLKCRSYSGIYSFNGRRSEPGGWSYGVALKYKLSVYGEFPSYCSDCERSFGVCGYGGDYDAFICNCPSGFNSSTDCFFGYTSFGSTLLYGRSIGLVMLVYCMASLFWFF